MIIAVVSGKGGTGKTTIATGLALSLTQDGLLPILIDCDVENPNAGLFLTPTIQTRHSVSQPIPQVGESVLVFSNLCHSCGSCILNCPTNAIEEVLHSVGQVDLGQAGGLAYARGLLKVGEPSAVPVIRELKRLAVPPHPTGQPVILDGPPGAACPLVETLRRADVALMVSTPTPFGLHDLRQAVQVARNELGLPVAVVINRDGLGDQGVEEYCAEEGIPILLRIPHDLEIARACSDGIPLVEVRPEYRDLLRSLFEALEALAANDDQTGASA